MMASRIDHLGGCALLLLGFGACRVTAQNEEHCGFQGGDRYCQALDAERPYCVSDELRCHIGDGLGVRSGCVSQAVFDVVEPSCHWVCGAGASDVCERTDADASSTTTSEDATGMPQTATVGTATVVATETGVPLTCEDHGACTEPQASICDGTACISCSDADAGACAERDPATPVCRDGACAAAACDAATHEGCDGQTPICDPQTLTCRGCVEHAECGPGGMCFAHVRSHPKGGCLTRGYYVDAAAEGRGDGSSEAPFDSLATALDATPTHLPIVLWLRDGSYTGELTVPRERVVGLTRAPDAQGTRRPVIHGLDNRRSIFSVENHATVLFDSIHFTDSQNQPVFRSSGELQITRSTFTYNKSGIVVSDTGFVTIVNSVLFNNGASRDGRPLFRLSSGDVLILYSTFFANLASDGFPLHFDCVNFSTVGMRNTIMVSFDSYVPRTESDTDTGSSSSSSSSGGDDSGSTSGELGSSSGGSDASSSGTTGYLDTDAGRELGDSGSTGDTLWGNFEPPPGASRSSSCIFQATYSAVDAPELVGEGSTLLEARDSTDPDPENYDPAWFIAPEALDFRLSAQGRRRFGRLGQWRKGDPPIDWAGQPRVNRDGATEAAGAALP